jgi:energy-coupling factor transporter transmembrane protein EcfT
MITYAYWILVITASLLLAWVGTRFLSWKIGLAIFLLAFLVGWATYKFHYEQLFVKNYGGIMSIEVPEGQMHLFTTWKDNHLWIENYDPKANTCIFSEYSKGHLLQGQVVIKNCNPLSLPRGI